MSFLLGHAGAHVLTITAALGVCVTKGIEAESFISSPRGVPHLPHTRAERRKVIYVGGTKEVALQMEQAALVRTFKLSSSGLSESS